MAIHDASVVDFGANEVISLETFVTTTDVPTPVFANVVIADRPMEVIGSPATDPDISFYRISLGNHIRRHEH